MRKNMLSVLVSILLFILAINVWMYFKQPSLMFYADRNLISSPHDWGLAHEDLFIKSNDHINLHAWYIPHKDSDKVVLFFHGNGGNISHRGETVSIFNKLGLSVFIIDYRGYGRSQGKPSENGLHQDARAAWNFLVDEKKFAAQNIIIFGRSLGGAVATRLATQVNPFRVILESTFSSAGDIAKSVFPVLSRLIILRYQFNSLAQINKINSPVLILHSTEDELIPFDHAKILFQAAHEPKKFVTLTGNHNSGFLQSQPQYQTELYKYIFDN